MKDALFEDIVKRKKQDLFRSRRIIESAQGALVKIDGQQYSNFSSNDYLGFANNEQLKACLQDAIIEYGIGSGSSQLLVGHAKPHKELEEGLAEFLGRDRALVFSSGYHANLAIASGLINSKTIILQDKLNHASLLDSALLSRGKLQRYRHNDPEHLEGLLVKHKQARLIVMTDAVFSMDGDYALLK